MKWLVATIVVLLAALGFGLGLLSYAMYVLLGILLASRMLTRWWVEGLAASRECNRVEVDIGDRVAVVVLLRNEGRLPVPWVLVEDQLPAAALYRPPPALKLHGRRAHLLMLRPGGRKTLAYQLECCRRGLYQVGPLIVETGDPFGLHRRFRMLTSPHFVLVYPRVLALEGYDVASRRPIGEIRLSHRLYEDPTRTAGVRRYAAGDPLNRIHWRATARTGALHSKVYEPSSVAGASLLLDFHRDGFDAHHEPQRSELAVTAAASIAYALYEMNQQVGLFTNGHDAADRIRREEGWQVELHSREAAREAAAMRSASDRLAPLTVATARGPEQLHRILETLARAELADGLPFANLVLEVAPRLPRDATVLAIVSRADPAAAIALGGLRRQGLAVEALVNVFGEFDFEDAAAPLVAEGIPVRQLRDEASIAELCRQQVLTGSLASSAAVP